jgi:hypothetical protein
MPIGRSYFFRLAHFGPGANALAGMLKSAKAGNADHGDDSCGNENLLGDADVIARGHHRLVASLFALQTNQMHGSTLPSPMRGYG